MNTFLANGDLYISEIQYKTSDYRSLCMWTCYVNLHVLLSKFETMCIVKSAIQINVN